MRNLINKRWIDLTQEEKENFLVNCTISTANIKISDNEFKHALVYNKGEIMIACTADKDGKIVIKNTAVFITKDDLKLLKEIEEDEKI